MSHDYPTRQAGFEVLAQPSGVADENPTAWNVQLTRLLRNTDRYAWGNWTLDPTIQCGTCGWFNPTDSQFQSAQVRLNVDTVTASSSSDWHLEQGNVKQSSVGVSFDVPYRDPTTGTEVNVGLQTTWDFGTEGSLVSTGSSAGVEYVENFARAMQEHYRELLEIAKRVNKAHGDEIDQGFGMITRVWLTDGCVNVGSRRDHSNFSIVGSVDGVSAMTGSDQSASLKGSYKSTSSTDNVEKRIFPSKGNQVETKPVAYAYEFTSFAGRVVVPRWIAEVPYLNLWFDNGGSYIVDATVSYTSAGSRIQRKLRISGGMDGQITDLPLDATEMDIRMDFKAGATQFLRVSNPLNTWELGRGHIKLTGWWPGRSGAAWV